MFRDGGEMRQTVITLQKELGDAVLGRWGSQPDCDGSPVESHIAPEAQAGTDEQTQAAHDLIRALRAYLK